MSISDPKTWNGDCSSGSCRIDSDKSLLELCGELHDFLCGSLDKLSDGELQHYYTALAYVVHTWKYSSQSDYSESVLNLIKSVLREYDVICEFPDRLTLRRIKPYKKQYSDNEIRTCCLFINMFGKGSSISDTMQALCHIVYSKIPDNLHKIVCNILYEFIKNNINDKNTQVQALVRMALNKYIFLTEDFKNIIESVKLCLDMPDHLLEVLKTLSGRFECVPPKISKSTQIGDKIDINNLSNPLPYPPHIHLSNILYDLSGKYTDFDTNISQRVMLLNILKILIFLGDSRSHILLDKIAEISPGFRKFLSRQAVDILNRSKLKLTEEQTDMFLYMINCA